MFSTLFFTKLKLINTTGKLLTDRVLLITSSKGSKLVHTLQPVRELFPTLCIIVS